MYPAPALAADRSGPSVPKRHDCRGEPSAVTQALAKARNVPSVIRITGPMPEFVSGDLHDVRLGSGIWISSAIPMEAYAGRDASGLVVDVEDLPAGLRARRSPDPREPGDDLWPVLRQFAVVERSPVANTLYAPPRGPGIWFEDKGSHDLKFFEHFPTQVAAAREVPDHPEMVDGLQVTRYQFAAPDASVGVHFYCARLAAPNPEPWGWDVASGEYVFSCLIRAEREVRVHMGISRLDEQRPRVTRFLPGAPHFQQVWFPFYHLNPNDRDRWDDEAVVGSQPRTLCITVQPTRYRPVPVSDKYTNTFAVGMFAVHPLGAARPS